MNHFFCFLAVLKSFTKKICFLYRQPQWRYSVRVCRYRNNNSLMRAQLTTLYFRRPRNPKRKSRAQMMVVQPIRSALRRSARKAASNSKFMKHTYRSGQLAGFLGFEPEIRGSQKERPKPRERPQPNLLRSFKSKFASNGGGSCCCSNIPETQGGTFPQPDDSQRRGIPGTQRHGELCSPIMNASLYFFAWKKKQSRFFTCK